MAFTPSDLFSLGEDGGWYDPSDLSTLWQDTAGTVSVTAAGQSVARIDDKSGNGRHLLQSTSANRPTYQTSGGLHWLDFDGTDDFLQLSANSPNITEGAGALACAASSDNEEVIGGLLEEIDEISGPAFRNILYFDTRSGTARIFNYAPDSTSRFVDLNSQISGAEKVFIASSDGVTAEAYLDDVQQGSPVDATANFANNSKITLGKQDAGNLLHDGKIYGAIILDRGLTSMERTDLNAWLSEKMGIIISLARTTQLAALTLSEGETDARITQAPVLALTESAADARATQAPVLVLTQVFTGAFFTQAPVLVLADQVPCLTRWAQVWTVTRTDGVVNGFTSLDRDLTFKGVVHKSCGSMSATAVDMSSIVGGQGSQELRGILSDAGVNEVDLYHGLYDGAILESWMVPWENSGGELPTPLIRGVLGRDNHDVNEFSIELLTDSAKLQQTAMLENYTPTCRYGFGTSNDSRCPVDLGPLTVSGSVTGTEALIIPNNGGRRIFTDSTRGEADGHFDLGQITWTSGANAGASSEIKSFVAGRFELWDATLNPIALSDGYDATPGCNKSTTDHLRFNSDLVDFGGFPHVPGNDSIFDTPDSKET